MSDRRTRALGVLLAGLAVLGVLAGCSAGRDATDPAPPSPSRDGGADTTARTTQAPAPVSAPPAPERGACYRLTLDQLARSSNDSDPVPCPDRHDAQTIHVGRLDLDVAGHRLAVDADRVRAQMADTCRARMAAHVGGTPEDRDLGRFEVVWFAPTLDQAGRGADWFRCDLVAIAGPDRLFPLPPPGRTAGVLDGADALATYGLCGTAEPGTRGFARVICGRRHSWQAIATIPLSGGDAYPGAAAVRRAGDDACRDQASAAADDPLTFEYGWEWPSRQQWQHGQRFGYCWVPA